MTSKAYMELTEQADGFYAEYDGDAPTSSYSAMTTDELMTSFQNSKSDAQKMAYALDAEYDALKSMALTKNRLYGNSAANPKRIFSKLDAIAAINCRIDDKLARIESQQADDTEDSELDLIGYLILKRVVRKIGVK